jgi:hypothetical protein
LHELAGRRGLQNIADNRVGNLDGEGSASPGSVCHGDLVTLYIEGPGGAGYAKVDSFETERFLIHTDNKPPNFERCCVFEALSLESDAEYGSVIRCGNPNPNSAPTPTSNPYPNPQPPTITLTLINVNLNPNPNPNRHTEGMDQVWYFVIN